MKKSWKRFLPSLLLLLLLPVAASEVHGFPGMGKVGVAAPAEVAPDFALKDLQGRNFKLSEQRGKPVLLVFGATWCPSCREEIPHLKEIYAKYTSKGLVIVNVDVDEPQAQVARFAEKYKLPYRVVVDERARVARNYHVWGVPNFILLDKEGKFVCQECQEVEPLLEKLLRR